MGSSCRSLLCHPFQILAILVLAIGLSACGSDGSDGKDGKDGAPGEQGPPGEAAFDPASVDPFTPDLDLSGTVSVNNGTVTIHFFLTDEDGDGIDVLEDGTGYTMRIYVSEYVPNPDPAPANPDYEGGGIWTQRISERGTPTEGDMPGTLTLVDAATGEYTYVCATQLAVPASGNVFRATVRTRWRETIDGERVYFAYPANGSNDFLENGNPVPAGAGTMPVSNEACASCHGQFVVADPHIGHGGGYTEATTCVHCHNYDYQVTQGHGDAEAVLPFMIHTIHNAGDLPALGEDFSEVTYPQEISTCTKCHSGADAPDADQAYSVMSQANCGSCHTNVDFTGGGTHPAANDGECGTCHRPGGLAPYATEVHNDNIVVPPENVSEYAVDIAMTAPANTTHYVDGETPVVTVTLRNTQTDAAEDPNGTALAYDANQSPQENTSDGQLHVANLFVYGPRSNAVPVLTTNSTTDGGAQQGHSLFLADEGGTPTADARVVTDATGYKYQLQDVAGLEPGTYMVRFEGEDYGTPGAGSTPEYWTASSNLITFQVGTADEQHKVSGDACTNCHGDTIMHLEGAHPHHAPFDTDYCLACHDLSDNYGDYIGNRVHAVHKASITGDLHASVGSRDWSEVTYPQAPNNCANCHTDPNAETPVWRDPNEIACGGCHGADPDANPVIYPDAEQDQVYMEAAAANHMKAMGGTFIAGTTNPYDPDYVVRSCIVCHGDGGIADPFVTHQLKNFPPPEDPT
jgi:OmcA/MtrC family decaheme c-type cytochrome